MMGRRGNGEGTITRRKDGRWEARYYVPTLNGTKRKIIYGKTQAEVRDKLTKALSDRIDGIVYDDENVTVGEYLWSVGSMGRFTAPSGRAHTTGTPTLSTTTSSRSSEV